MDQNESSGRSFAEIYEITIPVQQVVSAPVVGKPIQKQERERFFCPVCNHSNIGMKDLRLALGDRKQPAILGCGYCLQGTTRDFTEKILMERGLVIRLTDVSGVRSPVIIQATTA